MILCHSLSLLVLFSTLPTFGGSLGDPVPSQKLLDLALLFWDRAGTMDRQEFIAKHSSDLTSSELVQLMAYLNYHIQDREVFEELAKRNGPEEIDFLRDNVLLTGEAAAAIYLSPYRDPASLKVMSAYWYKEDAVFVKYFAGAKEKELAPILGALRIIGTPDGKPWDQWTEAETLAGFRPIISDPYRGFRPSFPFASSKFWEQTPVPAPTPSAEVGKYHAALRGKSWLVQRSMVLASTSQMDRSDVRCLSFLVASDLKLDPWVRAAAFDISGPDDEEVRDQALASLKDPDPLVRVSAMRFLAICKGLKGTPPAAIQSFLKGPSLFEREAALALLAWCLPDDAAAEALIEGLHYESKTGRGPVCRAPEMICGGILYRDQGRHPFLIWAIVQNPAMAALYSIQQRLKDPKSEWAPAFRKLLEGPFERPKVEARKYLDRIGQKSKN
jgi:hypothetical protein